MSHGITDAMATTDATTAVRDHNALADRNAAAGEPVHGHRMALIREQLTAAGYQLTLTGTRITSLNSTH